MAIPGRVRINGALPFFVFFFFEIGNTLAGPREVVTRYFGTVGGRRLFNGSNVKYDRLNVDKQSFGRDGVPGEDKSPKLTT